MEFGDPYCTRSRGILTHMSSGGAPSSQGSRSAIVDAGMNLRYIEPGFTDCGKAVRSTRSIPDDSAVDPVWSVSMPAGRKKPSGKERLSGVRRLLEEKDYDALVRSILEDPSGLRILVSLLHEPEDVTRWRAIEILGAVAAKKADRDLDVVRDLVRRLFWSMNDESGNVGWHAPEAIGETLARVTPLIDEFGGPLTSFLREEPFEKGVHWALARIVWVRPSFLPGCRSALVQSLSDPVPFIRGHSALALGAPGVEIVKEELAGLMSDGAVFPVYLPSPGEMVEVSVGAIVRAVLAQPYRSETTPAHLYRVLRR